MTKAEQIAQEEFPLEAFPKDVGDSMRLAWVDIRCIDRR